MLFIIHVIDWNDIYGDMVSNRRAVADNKHTTASVSKLLLNPTMNWNTN